MLWVWDASDWLKLAGPRYITPLSNLHVWIIFVAPLCSVTSLWVIHTACWYQTKWTIIKISQCTPLQEHLDYLVDEAPACVINIYSSHHGCWGEGARHYISDCFCMCIIKHLRTHGALPLTLSKQCHHDASIWIILCWKWDRCLFLCEGGRGERESSVPQENLNKSSAVYKPHANPGSEGNDSNKWFNKRTVVKCHIYIYLIWSNFTFKC